MRYLTIILAMLAAIPAMATNYVTTVAHTFNVMYPEPSVQSISAETARPVRATISVVDGVGAAYDLSDLSVSAYMVQPADGVINDDPTLEAEVLDATAGVYRVSWTPARSGYQQLVVNAIDGDLEIVSLVGRHDVFVTDPPAALATVTVNPTSSFSVVNNIYITNATYVTGGLISNVVTGASNYWDTATGTLHINQDGCQSYTIGTTGQAYNTVWQIDDCSVLIGTNAVTTLGGYTAQQIADLERSSANFDFTVLAWTPTVSVSRADGVFQYLTTEGPTWVQVPAGLTNMGYMINLDVAATTNSITFLPDNILIATNLYTYTNRTMTFLLHNPWNEETVGVYGLKRDND